MEVYVKGKEVMERCWVGVEKINVGGSGVCKKDGNGSDEQLLDIISDSLFTHVYMSKYKIGFCIELGKSNLKKLKNK